MKTPIQDPGRGSNRAMAGTRLASASGAANPTPSAIKIANASGAGAISAKPSAAPMNGAVQGVATTVANTPVAKAPNTPSRPANRLPMPTNPRPNSATPERLSPIANSR